MKELDLPAWAVEEAKHSRAKDKLFFMDDDDKYIVLSKDEVDSLADMICDLWTKLNELRRREQESLEQADKEES